MFDDLDESFGEANDALTDEIAAYLSSGTEKCSDPIRWWKSNARTYPKLHRMAIDYLCIPGASSLAA